jgi:hypothetical protein
LEKEVEGRRKLYNEELHNFCLSPNIRMLRSRGMRSVGRVARVGGKKTAIGFWWESHKELDH